MNAVETSPRAYPRCFCGIYAPLTGCIFHAGDLRERVARLMSCISLVDTEYEAQMSDRAKWLAFVISQSSARGQVRDGDLVLFGDVTLDYSPDREFRWDYMSQEEQAALTGEALKGCWPWAGGS